MYEYIIDTCYWPLIDIAKDYKFKTGIEFPTNTIQIINEIDPLFIRELKKLSDKGKYEIICSSREQTIFPLIPEQVNLQNLTIGKTKTEEIFSKQIDTAFINEQLFSSGLVSLYTKSGIKNIITVWEWASKIHSSKNEIKFQPNTLSSQTGEHLDVIWSSYIAYQKFQRYINGDIEKNDYLQYILKQKNSSSDSCFPFYSSDLEIFGYNNPVLRLAGDGNEIHRFRQILDELEKDSGIEFILPSDVLKKFPPKEKILMDSAKYSILQKKQDKFSVSRWAVCGRDNSTRNSLCYQLFKELNRLKSLEGENNLDEQLTNELIDCWASDFRTHTTDAKNLEFSKITNTLSSKLNEKIEYEINKKFKGFKDDLIIYNPNTSDWYKIPYEIKLFFKPGSIKNNFELYSDEKLILSQLENKKFYRDDSLRSCTIVFEPFIKKNSIITVNFVIKDQSQNESVIPCKNISTKNTELTLLTSRGGSINELIFPKIHDESLIGFLEHGTYDDTKLSPDFYSGHTVSFDRNGNKITDLIKTEIFTETGNFPIRKRLFSKLELPFGSLIKQFFVYENLPMIDLRYSFYFKDFRPASFRTAILTLNPTSFSKEKLHYSLHNGGTLESYDFAGQLITQDESTDPRLSASGCQGTTNCLIDVGDDDKGITIFSDKSKWYSVPLLNYRELENNYFCRISNSMLELDDTTMAWWKGRRESEFRIMGRQNQLDDNYGKCSMMFVGLLCKSSNPNITVFE
jgi:hypothetical protein